MSKTTDDLIKENAELLEKVVELSEKSCEYVAIREKNLELKLECKAYGHKLEQIASFCDFIKELCIAEE
jgi:hypothetical protein